MALQVTCPRCRCPFTITALPGHRTVQCQTCGQSMMVQAPVSSPAEDVHMAQAVQRAPGAAPAGPAPAWSDWLTHSSPASGAAPGPPAQRRRRGKSAGEDATRPLMTVLLVGGIVAAVGLLVAVGLGGLWLLAQRASGPPPAIDRAWDADGPQADPIQAAPPAGPQMPVGPRPGDFGPPQGPGGAPGVGAGRPGFGPGAGGPPGQPGFGPGAAGPPAQPGFGPGAGGRPGFGPRGPMRPRGPRQGRFGPGPGPAGPGMPGPAGPPAPGMPGPAGPPAPGAPGPGGPANPMPPAGPQG